MYLADQLSLALYASGMTTGVSVSSGFSVTEAAVVYEGHTLPHTAQQLDIAGQQLTENLRLLLRDNKGLNFVSSSEWQLVNTMKETLAYVAQGLFLKCRQPSCVLDPNKPMMRFVLTLTILCRLFGRVQQIPDW